MAKSNVTTVTKKEITLTLDEDEAEALVDILYCVGGSPDKSPRGKASAVTRALESAGVKHRGGRISGAIYFKDFDGKQPAQGMPGYSINVSSF